MTHAARGPIFPAALVAGLVLASAAAAQPPAELAATSWASFRTSPTPARQAAQPEELPRPREDVRPATPGDGQRPFFFPGSAGPYASEPPQNNPLLPPEPFRVERTNELFHWFVNVDLGVVSPHITSHVTSGTPLSPAFAAPVNVPVADLDWTVSPRIELGWHMPRGLGDLRVAYRGLWTTGSETAGAAALHSRLDLNVVDLDYLSSEWLVEVPELLRDLRWGFGVRIASVYFNSSALLDDGVDGRFSNCFVGAGPHFELDYSKRFGWLPFGCFFRLDGAGLIGCTSQNFAETLRPGDGVLVGATRHDRGVCNGVAVVGAEAGLCWLPTGDGRLRLALGYQIEGWWDVGATDNTDANLILQGGFVRAEWQF